MPYIQKRRIEGTISASISATSATNIIVCDVNRDRTNDGIVFDWSSGAELSAGQTWEVWLQSPIAVSSHSLIMWRPTGSFQLDIYENPTPTGAFTNLTLFNRNRNSAAVASTIVRVSDTQAAVLGTRIGGGQWHSPESHPPDGSWCIDERILKIGAEDYLLKFENIDTILGYVSLELVFQEV